MANPSGDNIEIALEPEAASLACRIDLQSAWNNLGKPPKLRYIVVDCGGGTVDVTVDEVDMATSEINEVHAASGGAWGGTEVDKRVLDVIHRAIGVQVAKKIDQSSWLIFERNCIEDGKKIPEEGSKAVIDITTELLQAISEAGGNLAGEGSKVKGVDYRKRRSAFNFTPEVMEECYGEPIDQIVAHTRKVLADVGNIHCILMVGGFSECPLLMRRMEETFQTASLRVIRPSSASLAVVKGAVMYGQNPNIVQSRVLRYSYGIDSSVEFVDGKHPEHLRRRDDGVDYCRHVFAPYARAGDTMRVDSKVTIPIQPQSAQQKAMRLQLYRSKSKNVEYTTEAGCEALLVFRVNMPRLDEGMDRVVNVTMDFSRTSLNIKALDLSSGQTVNAQYNDL